jgi:hypothetical protein
MARKIPGAWDLHRDGFFDSAMAALFANSYQGYSEHWTEAPPLPSIALVRIPETTVKTVAIIGRNPVPETEASSFLDPRVGLFGDARLVPEPFDGEEVDVLIKVWREIRLAIGPGAFEGQIAAMFESRAFIEVQIGSDEALPFLPSCDIGMATRDGGCLFGAPGSWRRIGLPHLWRDAERAGGGLEQRLLYWPTEPLRDREGSKVEHWYVSWTPADAAHVSHWLDRPASSAEAMFVGQEPRREVGTYWFTNDRLAFHLERHLHDGSLECALRERIEVVRTALERRKASWRAAALSEVERLVGELRSDMHQEEGGEE